MTDINARYIVITPADKGGCRIESLDPSVLLKRLEEEYYGPKKWSATMSLSPRLSKSPQSTSCNVQA